MKKKNLHWCRFDKPIILILVNGHPLTINWANRYVDGIIETWFSNSKVGQAVAETIFGDNNPAGRLPVTFPKTTGQIEYNFPYKQSSQADEPEIGTGGYSVAQVNGALYPFGYGLSYTTFEYSNLKIVPDKCDASEHVTVSFDIKNTGTRKDDEVVQIYVKDLVSSVTTYEYMLRGFDRVPLDTGEMKTIEFILDMNELAILDKDMKWTVEPGKFEVFIGSSSADLRLRKEFEVIH
jgi:beta-glucosidase